MPVFNSAGYLSGAIDSILSQSFHEFELLVVDDGSTDSSRAIIAEYVRRDRRVRLLARDQNLGIASSLNEAIEQSLGEYICRMDADDISLPRRLQLQVDYLDRHPHIGVLGTGVWCFDHQRGRVWRLPRRDEDCRARLLFSVPVAHPTVMMRASLFSEHGLRYDPSIPHAQDYDLWVRAMSVTSFANLSDMLVNYREHSKSVSKAAESQAYGERFEIISAISERLLVSIGLRLTLEERYVHFCLGLNQRLRRGDVEAARLIRHLTTLGSWDVEPILSRPAVRRLLVRRFLRIVYLVSLAGRPLANWREVLRPTLWRSTAGFLRALGASPKNTKLS